MTGPRFHERDHALYRILTNIAEAGMPTPRHQDLVKAMAASGHSVTKHIVANILLKLRQASLIDVLGSGDGSGDHRYYVIMGPDYKTVPRAKVADEGDQDSAYGEVLPCKAYDDAVAAKLFGVHEVRPRSRPVFVHNRLSGTPTRSFSGCSAAMVAE